MDEEPLIPLPWLRSGLLESLVLPERPLELDVLPVLPTLDRSLFAVLPTLLDAPKPLSLLLEPLLEFDELLFTPLRSELLDDEPLWF